VLQLEPIACPLCGERAAIVLFDQRDLALGVPGRFPLARCPRCGLLYQNPRVRADQLGQAYPEQYAAHVREPDRSRTVRRLGAGGRGLLARRLGYRHLDPGPVSPRERARAALAGRRILKAFPPWIGSGRLLDVGCASGKFLGQMAAVGWTCTGIELDPEAAARARTVAPEVFTGDPLDAPFSAGRFDLVMPRHLVHFTPATLTALAERAGGRVVTLTHRTKPRYLLRSVRHLLVAHDGRAARLASGVVESRPVAGALKLALEVAMPLARPLGLGEAIRCVIRPAAGRGPASLAAVDSSRTMGRGSP
jgi:SAM-dependent methyltransferase